MNPRAKAGIVIAVAVAVLFAAIWMLSGSGQTAVPAPTTPPSVTVTPSRTPTPEVTQTTSGAQTEPPTTSTSPAATPETPTPSPEGPEAPTTEAPPKVKDTAPARTCVTTATGGFTPTTFRAYRMGFKVSTLSVGLQDGAAGSPPKNQPYKVAWFDGSPRPGSNVGNVIVTTHTYSKGQALGNDLYGAKVLKKNSGGTRAGDVWSLSDGKGNVVCYEITGVTKVAVTEYDPNSNIIYDYAGPEELVMVVCWDKNWATGQWDSRVVFTGKRV